MTTHSNGKHTRSSSSPTHNHHKYYIKISSTWTEFIDPKITGFHFYIKSFPSRHQIQNFLVYTLHERTFNVRTSSWWITRYTCSETKLNLFRTLPSSLHRIHRKCYSHSFVLEVHRPVPVVVLSTRYDMNSE